MDRTDPDNPDEASDGPPDQGNEDSSLNRTGKIFGGLVADIRRRAPWYASDFKDGLHVQCLGSAFFMYCGCLTMLVMFGGLLEQVTNNNIAVIECLISGAICGVTYHMLCGQPLTILSSTAPILVFEGIVYNICRQFDWHYLGFRFWIGFWIFVIFLIFVAFDLSFLVRYITRFTQECFATMLAILVIYEAFKRQIQQRKFWHSMRQLDENCVCQFLSEFDDDRSRVTENVFVYGDMTKASNWTRDSKFISTVGDCDSRGGHLVGSGCKAQVFPPEFLFSLFLFLGTFMLLFLAKLLRKTSFLSFRVRTCISDLAVFVIVCLMVLLDAAVGLRTVKLRIPFSLEPPRPGHGWIINPLVNPWFSIVFAIPPAILAAILMFIDQHIPTVMITRKERKLKKGSGFHLDLLIIALQILLCSLFGCPWFVGATILSINHIHSLTVEGERTAPGQQLTFLGIREQRVTGILVSVLIGLSVFSARVLQFVPMSVLYGVLLYMGVASFKGMQFIERLMSCCKRRGCLANSAFLQKVSNRRACFFTFIQIACLAVLFMVKRIQAISILFPLTVVAMCIVRKALDWVFTYEELLYLDDILPGSRRRPTENSRRTENAGGMELQEEAAYMTPTAPNVTEPSAATGFSEEPPPFSEEPPPPYDVVVHQTK